MLQWLGKALGVQTKAQVSDLANPEGWLLEMFGASPTASGRSIGPRSALAVPAVLCAVTAITDTIATLPAKVLRRIDAGGKEPAPDHPAYTLVHDRAQDWQSAGALRKQVTTDAITQGNGYAWCNRVGDKPFELIRLDPSSVTVKPDDLTGEPKYTLRLKGGGTRTYDFSEIIHITGPSLDGCNGLPLIQLGRETIGIAAVIQEHVARLFSSGARPSGFFSPLERLQTDAFEKAKRAFNLDHSGIENAGKTLMSAVPMKYEQFAFKSTDAQLIEIWKLQIEEIARIFRLPPMFLQEFGRATLNNFEHASRVFLESILPWLRQWEFQYSRALFRDDERREFTVEFITDDLLRASYKERTEGLARLVTARIFNPNEARAKESMPPYPGGEEFVNPNTMTARKLDRGEVE